MEKGQSAKRQVRLFNPSNVSAQILIEDGTKADSVVPSDLVCPMQKAELGPGCTMMLPLLFKPLLGSNITIKRTVRVSCIQDRLQIIHWPDSIKKNENFYGFSDEGGFVCFRG